MQPHYDDFARAAVRMVIEGRTVVIPVDVRDAAYKALLDAGIVIGPYVPPPPPPPSADDVRAEASRRMRLMLGARDDEHKSRIIVNGTREATRLLRVRLDRVWTTEEAARAADLEAMDQAIEAIRAASNVMEAAPPADYASDERWP